MQTNSKDEALAQLKYDTLGLRPCEEMSKQALPTIFNGLLLF